MVKLWVSCFKLSSSSTTPRFIIYLDFADYVGGDVWLIFLLVLLLLLILSVPLESSNDLPISNGYLLDNNDIPNSKLDSSKLLATLCKLLRTKIVFWDVFDSVVYYYKV